jgi:hypothetical protein
MEIIKAQFRSKFPLSGQIFSQIPWRQTAQSSPHCLNVNLSAKFASANLADKNLPGLSQSIFSANSAIAAPTTFASARTRTAKQGIPRHRLLLLPQIKFLLNYNKTTNLSTYQGSGENDKIN